MELSFPKLAWDPKIFDRFVASAKSSIEMADFDTKGFIPTPADKIIRHGLGVLPSEVWIYSATDKDGTGMASDTFTACDRNNITITGPAAFCRVRMNKGG